ncbi:MAG: hypothetical protein IAF38_22400, partial [Bacteroidia bacterium]|nr:hypothetical protein [Bacteroidia bacterium]
MRLSKLLCIALFLVSISTISSQQKTEIKWGEKQDPKNFISRILGEDETGIYALAEKEKKFFIEKYSSDNFKQVFTKKLVFPDHLASKEEFEAIFFIKKQLFVFTSLYEIKANRYFIYIRKINAAGDIEPNENPVFEMSANRGTEHGNYKVEISADSSKFLIFNKSASLIDGKRKIKIGVIGTDLKLQIQFEENFEGATTFGYKEVDPRIWVAQALLSKDNKIYLLINKYSFLKETSEFSFIAYDIITLNKTVCPVELKDEKISNLSFSMGAAGILNLAGYYMDRVMRDKLKKYNNIIGVFFLKLDVFNNIITEMNKM